MNRPRRRSTAVAVNPGFTRKKIWWTRDPSLVSNNFSSRTARIVASAWWTPGTASAAFAAASSRSTFSCSGTANGSTCIGETHAPRTTGAGVSRIGEGMSSALYLAIATAERAAATTALTTLACGLPRRGAARGVAAKPHAPSTSTRTPSPYSSR